MMGGTKGNRTLIAVMHEILTKEKLAVDLVSLNTVIIAKSFPT